VPLRMPLTLAALAALAAGIGVRRDLRLALANLSRGMARRRVFGSLWRRRMDRARPVQMPAGRT